MNLRESAHTFYILTVNSRFFCGFSVNSRVMDCYFTRFMVFHWENLLREMPHDLKKQGISWQQIFWFNFPILFFSQLTYDRVYKIMFFFYSATYREKRGKEKGKWERKDRKL